MLLADHYVIHTLVELTPLIVGLVAVIPATLGAIFAYRGARDAKGAHHHSAQANDAVNNVHDSGHPRIYDQVVALKGAVHQGFEDNREEHNAIRSELGEVRGVVDGNVDNISMLVEEVEHPTNDHHVLHLEDGQ